jgi:hypothetical protein
VGAQPLCVATPQSEYIGDPANYGDVATVSDNSIVGFDFTSPTSGVRYFTMKGMYANPAAWSNYGTYSSYCADNAGFFGAPASQADYALIKSSLTGNGGANFNLALNAVQQTDDGGTTYYVTLPDFYAQNSERLTGYGGMLATGSGEWAPSNPDMTPMSDIYTVWMSNQGLLYSKSDQMAPAKTIPLCVQMPRSFVTYTSSAT